MGLEQEENKVLRAQPELNQVRAEIERRIAEKEEEFMLIKKAQSKGIESMQSALETESKGKAEALRMKKKLEGDVGELELALEHANAGAMATQGTIKKYQMQVRDAQVKVDDESRAAAAASDAKVAADRKAAATQNALEEARTMLEQADRQRRTLEQELADTNETLAELSNQNQAIASSKRKLESELNTLQADLDEMGSEARMSEEKAARAMIDAARLADELRAEQDVSADLEKAKRLLEAQCKDAQARADEAEMNALKGGKKAMLKMESRIHELESELDAESRRLADGMKSLRKSERRIKELTFSSDEDKKNHERMQVSLTSFRERSSLTRSRLRRQKKSLPSTWPSSARSRALLEMLRPKLMQMNRTWLTSRLALAPLLSDQFKLTYFYSNIQNIQNIQNP